jgi:hypothetical protein
MDDLESRAKLYNVSMDVLRQKELDVKVILKQFIPCRSDDLYQHITMKILDKVYMGDFDG